MVRKLVPRSFFGETEKERVVRVIREAERQTSGEIRIYLERKSRGEVLERAKNVFERLKMKRTKLRNGILIYFSLVDHSFAVLGDQGIHDKVGDSFWKEIVSTMEGHFSQDQFAEGLAAGIQRIGEKLKTYFPHEKGDINELRDEVQEG